MKYIHALLLVLFALTQIQARAQDQDGPILLRPFPVMDLKERRSPDRAVFPAYSERSMDVMHARIYAEANPGLGVEIPRIFTTSFLTREQQLRVTYPKYTFLGRTFLSPSHVPGPRPAKPAEVLVASRATGLPLQGAKVFCFDKDDEQALVVFDQLLDAKSLPSELRSSDALIVTDEKGIAQLPDWKDGLLVVVTSGKEVGFGMLKWVNGRLTIPRTPDLVTVKMGLPWTASVQVKDLSGTPGAWLPVTLEANYQGAWRTVVTRRADSTGLAEFNFANLYDDVRLKYPNEETPKYRVRVSNLTGEASAFDLVWDEANTASVEAKVDLGVEVFATFHDQADRILSQRESEGLSVEVTIPEFDMSGTRLLAPTRVRIGRLPRGAKWSIESPQFNRGAWAHTKKSYTVTTDLVSEEQVDFELPYEGLLLTGRFVSEDGSPRTGPEVDIEFQYDIRTESGRGVSGTARPNSIRADAEGRFLLRLARSYFDDRRGKVVTAALSFGKHNECSERGWSPNFSDRLDDELIDLGDIALSLPPLLLSGTVVDELGIPLGCIPIRAMRELNTATSNASRPTAQIGRYRPGTFDVETDSEGHFEVRGDYPPSSFKLEINDRSYVTSRSFLTEVGQSDLQLTLYRAGSLLSTSIAPMGPGWTAHIQLLEPAEPPMGHPGDTYSRNRTYSSRSTFRLRSMDFSRNDQALWWGLTPGRYRFELRHSSSPEPALALDDLIIRPGEELVDPRINGLDTKSFWGATTITLHYPDKGVSEEKLPLYEVARLGVREQGTIRQLLRFNTVSNASTTLSIPRPCLNVVMEFAGYRSVELAALSGDVEIELRPALAVELVWPEGMVPSKNASITVRLRNEEWLEPDSPEDRYYTSKMQLIKPNTGGQYMGSLPAPGRYEVLLWGNVPDSWAHNFSNKRIAKRIQIEDVGTGRQTVTIPITQEEYDAIFNRN